MVPIKRRQQTESIGPVNFTHILFCRAQRIDDVSFSTL